MSQMLLLCERLVCFAVFLQSLELLTLRRQFSVRGTWRWKTLQPAFWPLGPVFSWVLGDRAFVQLLVFQAVASAAMIAGWGGGAVMAALAVGCLLVSMRFLGTFNGGSDCMTLLVALSVAGAHLAGSGERAMAVALGYIAVQATLSYAVAGWVKLREPEWRSGTSLAAFLALPQYGVSKGVRSVLASRKLALWAAWSVIAAELGLAAVMLAAALGHRLPVQGALAVLGLGAAFHLLNVGVLGLNRFFWAWLSAYPALFFWLAG